MKKNEESEKKFQRDFPDVYTNHDTRSQQQIAEDNWNTGKKCCPGWKSVAVPLMYQILLRTQDGLIARNNTERLEMLITIMNIASTTTNTRRRFMQRDSVARPQW